MGLITKEIEAKAQEQFPMGSDMNQMVIASFFHPCLAWKWYLWKWYLMNQDPKDKDYLWGIVKGFAVEMGSFSLSDLEGFKDKNLGLGIERDLHFKPLKAKELWEKLTAGGGNGN